MFPCWLPTESLCYFDYHAWRHPCRGLRYRFSELHPPDGVRFLMRQEHIPLPTGVLWITFGHLHNRAPRRVLEAFFAKQNLFSFKYNAIYNLSNLEYNVIMIIASSALVRPLHATHADWPWGGHREVATSSDERGSYTIDTGVANPFPCYKTTLSQSWFRI